LRFDKYHFKGINWVNALRFLQCIKAIPAGSDVYTKSICLVIHRNAFTDRKRYFFVILSAFWSRWNKFSYTRKKCYYIHKQSLLKVLSLKPEPNPKTVRKVAQSRSYGIIKYWSRHPKTTYKKSGKIADQYNKLLR